MKFDIYKKRAHGIRLAAVSVRSFGFLVFCSEQVAHAEECVVHVYGTARHGEILSVGFRQSHLGANAEDEFSVVGIQAER